jgi:hypothetical protein
MKLLKYTLLLLIIVSCDKQKQNADDLPIARVYDNYLYTSQLKNVMPDGLTGVDSLTWVKDYVDKWVRKELILTKAEGNLTEDEKDVDKQIDDYRTSLLIFKYEQNLIRQKLDTNISKEEVEEYYNKNGSNFILNNNIVKALFIKLPRSAPDIWKLRRWYKSDNEEHIKELDAYCYNNAEKYDYFDEDWVQFDIIRNQMPRIYQTTENLLKYRKTVEVRDTTYYYFVRLYDYRLAGDINPLENVENNIKNIILNKRKIKYINRLESEIYNDALNRENFNIY